MSDKNKDHDHERSSFKEDHYFLWFMTEWIPCIFYVLLFVCSDILIAHTGGKTTAGKVKSFKYHPESLMILVELGKLVISAFILLWIGNVDRETTAWPHISFNFDYGKYFFIPAAIYTGWNWLNYQSLLHVPLSMFSVIYQVVVFFTAFFWTVAFKRRLVSRQWLALGILAVGQFTVHVKKDFHVEFNWVDLFVVAQAFCSALAGVVNEWLLKDKRHLNINEQNVYMYFSSTLCAVLFMLLKDYRIFKSGEFTKGFSGEVVAIVCLQITVGLAVSMILKHRSVIVKLFATALHSPTEVTTAHFVLGTDLTPMVGVAAFCIMCATILFYYKDIIEDNEAKKTQEYNVEEGKGQTRALLDKESESDVSDV